MEKSNDSKEIMIDANFFMVSFQFNLDIVSLFHESFPSYKLTTSNFVINELKGLKKYSKGKNKIAASISLKIAKSKYIKIKDFNRKENESADDALLRVSKILATNDAELRKRARKREIPVIFLRQGRYLAVDGYLS